MNTSKKKKALVSGASFAGLSTAYWLNKMGYKVTIVEISNGLKKGGTPVDIEGNTVDIVKRMGLFEKINANKLHMEMWEMKNADDITGYSLMKRPGEEFPGKEFEIERDVLLNMLFDTIENAVDFIFSNSITALNETKENIEVTFKDGAQHAFDLVFGCDGIHSTVRKIWFGDETKYSHFLGQYFSTTIVNKLLIKENTLQMYSEPNKGVMLYAYNNKTDIVLSFRPEKEISYDYHNEQQQRNIISEQFKAMGWRTAGLLKEVMHAETFYFDKYCQIKMPSWTKGRVALVGDAAYCASPAAGKGGSLAIDGAAALADAFQKHSNHYESAFQDYNKSFRSYIEGVQAEAANNLEWLLPRSEAAIRTLYENGFGI